MAHVDMTLDYEDRLRVDTVWNEKEEIKQIPGARWDANRKYWTVPFTWASCIQLRGVFRDRLTIGKELNEWAWYESQHQDLLMEMRSMLEPHERLRPGLYPFQEAGRDFLDESVETLLGDEMGTGKTVQTLQAMSEDGYPAIVICPNSVKRSWAEHVPRWTTVGVPYIITGPATQRARTLREAAQDPHAVIIVNYESLRTLSRLAPYGSTRLKKCRECDPRNGEEGVRPASCQVHPKELNRIPFKTVIIDEAHRIKSPSSQQTRAVWAVAHQPTMRYRWALTGTPLANHPGDLWSILHAISPRDFPTKTHFVDRYCLQSWNPFGGLDIVGINPATRDEFFRLLDPRFRRMPKDLVLSQLPPKIRTTRWVELTPKQRKAHNELEHNLGTLTDSGVLIAPNGLIANLRRMQLSSSTVEVTPNPAKLLGQDVRMIEPSPKLDALEEVMEEFGDKQLVVCAYHRQLIDLAAARLKKAGKSFGLITGGVSEYERDLALRQFQEGKLQYLLFTISAGGTGLTMTAADTMVFLQRSWSMIENKQAEDRVHRIGSERHESVNIIDIVAIDSVEEHQIESLTNKFMRMQEITRDRASIAAANGDTHALDEEYDRLMNSEL